MFLHRVYSLVFHAHLSKFIKKLRKLSKFIKKLRNEIISLDGYILASMALTFTFTFPYK